MYGKNGIFTVFSEKIVKNGIFLDFGEKHTKIPFLSNIS